MNWFFRRREWRSLTKLILKQQEIIMAQIDDLNTALASVDTKLSALQAAVKNIPTGGPDLSPAIAHVNTIGTAVDAIAASLPQNPPAGP